MHLPFDFCICRGYLIDDIPCRIKRVYPKARRLPFRPTPGVLKGMPSISDLASRFRADEKFCRAIPKPSVADPGMDAAVVDL
jgi:hypothetical protein